MTAKKYFTAEEKAEAVRRYAREAYHRNREKKLAAQKEWRDSDAGKEWRAEYQTEWRTENYEQALALNRKSRKKNRVKDRPLYASQQKVRRGKNLHLKSLYGITPEEWDAMKAKGCGICGTDRNLQVDHCHITGVVRGALCGMHNTALGRFGDDPHMLRKAIRWVGGNTGWQPSV